MARQARPDSDASVDVTDDKVRVTKPDGWAVEADTHEDLRDHVNEQLEQARRLRDQAEASIAHWEDVLHTVKGK